MSNLESQLWQISKDTDKSGDAQSALKKLYNLAPKHKIIKSVLDNSHIAKKSDGSYFENWGKMDSFTIDANIVYLLVNDMTKQIAESKQSKQKKGNHYGSK